MEHNISFNEMSMNKNVVNGVSKLKWTKLSISDEIFCQSKSMLR